MKPSTALETHRNYIREVTAKYRAANPRVFGSVVRGTDTSESDLDILVDALPGATLFDLGGLYHALESELGIRIDLVTPKELPLRIREKVLREAKPI